MAAQQQRWAVLGAGAVGCLWASHLHRYAGVTPTLLLRQAGATAPSWLFSRVEVHVETSDGDEWRASMPAQRCDGHGVARARDGFDVVLLMTKSYDAEHALALARPLMAPGARVVLMTNGALAAYEAVRRNNADLRLLVGSTTHGVLRIAPLHVRHTGRGQTWFGTLPSTTYFDSLAHLDHSVPPPKHAAAGAGADAADLLENYAAPASPISADRVDAASLMDYEYYGGGSGSISASTFDDVIPSTSSTLSTSSASAKKSSNATRTSSASTSRDEPWPESLRDDAGVTSEQPPNVSGEAALWPELADRVSAEWADVMAVLSRTQLGAEWDAVMQRRLWVKLAVNCAINPSTALANVPNGAMQIAAGTQIVRAVCSEMAVVMSALGVPASPSELEREVIKVARNTSLNYSSMHQDVTCKRKTEAPMITGYVVAHADRLGIPVPTIRVLDSLISLREWERLQS